MANIDEIFAAMPAAAAEADREYLVIDPVTRTITVPDSERIFGVTGDELADRKYFMCPRYVGDGLDLAGMFIRVNYRNAGGDEDGYLVEDVAVVGDYVTFSWRLWPKVTEYKGAIQFGVCADLPNTTERRFPDWNTTMAGGEVLEGLHPYDGAVEEETRDVVTQLRAETEAQTAAVAACGAEQVQAVQDAAAAATAAAEAQVAAKGAETLATIPEDYTTLANKTNEQANAIKGHLTGEIVQAGDVSPVEHYLDIKVSGKNLFNVSAAVNSNLVLNDDGSYTLTRSSDSARFSEYAAASAPAGSKVTVSVSSYAGTSGVVYFQFFLADNSTKSLALNASDTSATTILPADLQKIRLYISNSETMGAYATFEQPQVEIGDTATEYTPYIDPADVTVGRCGKNLLQFKDAFTMNLNDLVLQYDKETQVFTINGTCDTSAPTNFQMGPMMAFKPFITDKAPMTVSVEYVGGSMESAAENGSTMLYVTYINVGSAAVKLEAQSVSKSFALAAGQLASVWLHVKDTVTFTNYKFKVQIEHGDAATAYEPYNSATAMPDESGVVTGLPSLAPNMTLLADTAGVTIDCTYNRDSNAVYAELLAKIAALSGTN